MTSKTLNLGKDENGNSIDLVDNDRDALSLHVVGQPGTGKSSFLEYLIRQDIAAGRGLCLIDPHGTLYESLVNWCADPLRNYLERRKVVLFDFSDPEWTFGFNPFASAGASPEQRSALVDAALNACSEAWGGEDQHRTPLLRRCLRAIFTVLVEKGLTLNEAPHLMSSVDQDGLRRLLTENLEHPIHQAQWAEFNAMKPRDFTEAFASTNNRLIEFLDNPIPRRVLGCRDQVIDFRDVMGGNEILLVNLGEETLSRSVADLLGTLFINDLFLKAGQRGTKVKSFRLYIDECYRFLTEDVSGIVQERRKNRLHVVLAHQDLGQLRIKGEAIYRAVMGSIPNRVVFRIGDTEDALVLAQSLFAGEFDYELSKKSMERPTVVDYERQWMASESSTEGHSSTETYGDTESSTESQSYNADGEDAGASSTTGSSSSSSSATTSSYSRTEGRGEALVPVLKTLPTQTYSLEELRDMATNRLQNLPDSQAVVRLPGKPSVLNHVPFVKETKTRESRVDGYKKETFERTEFAIPSRVIDAQIAERRTNLIQQLTRSEEKRVNLDDDWTPEPE